MRFIHIDTFYPPYYCSGKVPPPRALQPQQHFRTRCLQNVRQTHSFSPKSHFSYKNQCFFIIFATDLVSQILATKSWLQQPGHQILGSTSWLPHQGYQILPSTSWFPHPGYQILATTSWLPHPGYYILATRSWLPDPGFHILATRSSWLPHPGYQILASTSWLLHPGFQILAMTSWLPGAICSYLKPTGAT